MLSKILDNQNDLGIIWDFRYLKMKKMKFEKRPWFPLLFSIFEKQLPGPLGTQSYSFGYF